MINLEELVSHTAPDFPMVIPTYNNFTYLRNTMSFWSARGFNDFVIIDCGSTYSPMVELLQSTDAMVLSLPDNPGPRAFYENSLIYFWLPQNFIVTDPDLRHKDALTLSDIDYLVELTNLHGLFKIGSSLNLDMTQPSIVDDIYLWGGQPNTIRSLESLYYTNCIGLGRNDEPIFSAPVDTTFSVYNKKYDQGFFSNNARIGGIYLADHLGWLVDHPIPVEERNFYLESVKNIRHASNEVIRRGESW